MTNGSNPVKYVKVRPPKIWAVASEINETTLFKLFEEKPINRDLVMCYILWNNTPQGWNYWNKRHSNPSLVSNSDLSFIVDSLGYRIVEFSDDEWD